MSDEIINVIDIDHMNEPLYIISGGVMSKHYMQNISMHNVMYNYRVVEIKLMEVY